MFIFIILWAGKLEIHGDAKVFILSYYYELMLPWLVRGDIQPPLCSLRFFFVCDIDCLKCNILISNSVYRWIKRCVTWLNVQYGERKIDIRLHQKYECCVILIAVTTYCPITQIIISFRNISMIIPRKINTLKFYAFDNISKLIISLLIPLLRFFLYL